MPDLTAYLISGWVLVGIVVSYRVEPKVTRLAFLVVFGILTWPLTAFLGYRRAIVRRRVAEQS